MTELEKVSESAGVGITPLGALPSPALPVLARPESKEGRALLTFVLPGRLSAELHRTAALHHLEIAAVLFTAFQELLCRWQTTAAVAFCHAGRTSHRFVWSNQRSFLEAVREVEAVLRQPAAVSATSLAADGQFSFNAGVSESASAEFDEPLSPIHLSVRSDKTLSGSLDYDHKVWSQAVVQRLAQHYEYILSSALFGLDSPLGELEILRASDSELLDSWNRTARRYPQLSVDELFRQQVEARPDAAALSFAGKTLTYRSLAEQADQLARRLQSLGVRAGALIGVCMDRSQEMVVALLAIFRAGAGYLPLDPGFPSDRISFMLEDARPAAIITQTHLREKLSQAAARIVTFDSLAPEPLVSDSLASDSLPPDSLPPDSVAADWAHGDRSATAVGRRLDGLAYVLYTSGSTGRPKGVPISQRALTNLLTAVAPQIDLGPGDTFLATSTISFDISVFELFAPLVTGAHLVVAPRSVTVDGELLADAIRTTGATVLQATPSGWRILVEGGWQGQAGLKMLTAGEPLDRTLAARLLERGAALWNLYGPTEATIYATGCQVRKTDSKITVGRPLANYKAYVLDQQRKRIPIGAVGELYLGGLGVAQGYLNRAELSAEKFIPDPFDRGADCVLYRTGDLARFLEDGQIELLGRADNQVKLRGYRIELEEIEALLDSNPGVRKSVVKVFDLAEGDQRLVAYVVPREPATFDEGELREFASQALPSYMVPSLFIRTASFALTPNGKVDRKALPIPPGLEPDRGLLSSSPQAGDAALEEALLACWRSVLLIPDLGLDFNFFDMGGHSLLAARLFARITAEIGLKLPIGLLVEAPTPRLLAERIRKIQRSPIGCLVPMQIEGERAPLYMIHHLLGDILLYRTLAEGFAPDRPVIGVQAPTDLIERSERYTIETLATRYIDEILERQPEGPFHLAGFSSGSTLAFEMARQFTQRGHTVGLLALIDGDINGPRPRQAKAVRYWKIVNRKFCKVAFKLKDELKEHPRQFIGKRVRFLRFLWKMRTANAAYQAGEAKNLTVEQTLALAEHHYHPQPYAGPALLIRFHDEAWQHGPDPLMGWSHLVQGGITVVDLPGGHMTGMGALRAPHTASVLSSAIENAEAFKEYSKPLQPVSSERDQQESDASFKDGQSRTGNPFAQGFQRWNKNNGDTGMAVESGAPSLTIGDVQPHVHHS